LVADCEAVGEYGTQPHEVVEMLAAEQPTTMNVDYKTVDVLTTYWVSAVESRM